MQDLAFSFTQSSTLKILVSVHENNETNASRLNSQYEAEIRLFYQNIENIISILPVFLVVFGTLGNLIALYVLTRKKLRSQSTMIYFASLTVMDTVSLYQWYVFFIFVFYLG